jgi:hypothetical protein
MNWKEIFSLRDLSYLMVFLVTLWTCACDYVLLSISYQLAVWDDPDVIAVALIGLMSSVFLVALIGGFLAGRIAKDGRGPAYGVYGSLLSVIMILYTILPNLTAIPIALAAILGGLNGGMFSMRRRRR